MRRQSPLRHWGAGEPKRWYDVKGALVAALPDNGFDCAPVSLSALVAWNGRELGLDTADLVDALAARWDGELCTWIDGGRGRRARRAGSERSKRCCRCS